MGPVVCFEAEDGLTDDLRDRLLSIPYAPAHEVCTHENDVHVYPQYGREHVTNAGCKGCWCSAQIENLVDGNLVIHREQN